MSTLAYRNDERSARSPGDSETGHGREPIGIARGCAARAVSRPPEFSSIRGEIEAQVTEFKPYSDGTSDLERCSFRMDGMIMSRMSRLDREAESLWRAMSPEPPPKGLRGADLLSAALALQAPSKYDRIHSPHLRPTQIVRPR